MNDFLALAPDACVAHGQTACLVSLNDTADRPPRALQDGEVIELGAGKRLCWLDTPHMPHGWEAGLFYEEATGTLLCGDLFTQLGVAPALTQAEILTPAIAAAEIFEPQSGHACDLSPVGRAFAQHAGADARPILPWRRRRRSARVGPGL
jgi:hypothetical protein